MATIKDVAKRAGVSIATVSYVMNNDLRISEATAKKVRQSAEELNYLASGIARSLKKAKTDNVLVLVHNFSGPIYQEILEEIHTTLKKHNYRMIVSSGELAYSFLSEKHVGFKNADTTVSGYRADFENGFPIIDQRKVFGKDSKIIVKRD